jgi:hypothetical protein
MILIFKFLTYVRTVFVILHDSQEYLYSGSLLTFYFLYHSFNKILPHLQDGRKFYLGGKIPPPLDSWGV